MASTLNQQVSLCARLFFTHLLVCLLGQHLQYAEASRNWYLQEVELRELVANNSLHLVTEINKVRVALDDGDTADFDVRVLSRRSGEIALELNENKTVVTHQDGSCLFQSTLCIACDYDVCSSEFKASTATPASKSRQRLGAIATGLLAKPTVQDSAYLIRNCCDQVNKSLASGLVHTKAGQRGSGESNYRHPHSQLRPKTRQLAPSRFGSSGGRSRDIFFNTGRLYDRGVTDVMAGRFSALAVTGRCVGTRLQCREP